MVVQSHYISIHEKLAGPTEEEHLSRATATCTLCISEQRMPNLVCEPLQSIYSLYFLPIVSLGSMHMCENQTQLSDCAFAHADQSL